jgi:hypothetical protein
MNNCFSLTIIKNRMDKLFIPIKHYSRNGENILWVEQNHYLLCSTNILDNKRYSLFVWPQLLFTLETNRKTISLLINSCKYKLKSLMRKNHFTRL